MKTKIILFVFIVVNTISVTAQTTKDPYVFKVGGVYNLFGNNINVREEPNTTSEIVAILPITSKVEVLEKTDLTYNINGADWSFYKIKSDSIVGYVTGGLLAINEVFNYQDKELKLSVFKCGPYSYTYHSDYDLSYETNEKTITYGDGLIYREYEGCECNENHFHKSEKYYIFLSGISEGDIVNELELKARSLRMIKFLKNNEHFISKKIIGRREGIIFIDGSFGDIEVDCFIERTDDTIILFSEYFVSF